MALALADDSVAPGTRLDQRYRLDALLARGDGSSLWRGTDELLRRSVAVHMFDLERGRSRDVFAAVRRVCGLTHGGLTQVFDANEDASRPYLVREWTGGRDLRGVIVGDGPLEPRFTAEVFRQASAALAVAHGSGVFHLRLSPRSIVWSRAGQVKVVGLGVEAALAGARVDDPERADIRALARLLSATLAGRWRHGVDPVRPTPERAVRAWMARHCGVGRELVSIARCAMGEGGRPIGSLNRLTAELARVALGGESSRVGAAGVSDPVPALARARARVHALPVSTKPIRAVRPVSGRRGAAA